jgi:hypothetical protein
MLAHACGIVGQEHAQCTLAYDGRVAMKNSFDAVKHSL